MSVASDERKGWGVCVCVRACGGGGAGRGATVGGAAALEVSDCARYPPDDDGGDRTSERALTGQRAYHRVRFCREGCLREHSRSYYRSPADRCPPAGGARGMRWQLRFPVYLFFFFSYNNNILYTPAYTTAADVTLPRRSTGYYTRSRRRR